MSQSSKGWTAPPPVVSSPVPPDGGVALEDIYKTLRQVRNRQNTLFGALDHNQRALKLLEGYLDQIGPEARDVETKVPESLFDANTILKADTDDVPVALPVAASRVVGRTSSSTITDLTMAELATLLDTADALEVAAPFALTNYMEKNVKNAREGIHGNMYSLASAQTLDSGTDVTFDAGLGKMVIIVNDDGGTNSGTMTVTGMTVNRETQAESAPTDTDVITVTGPSTDSTANDANGITRWSMTGAYITSKWFTGSITISTTDLDCNLDVYHCSFEQLNDDPDAVVQTLDINAFQTNTNAYLSAHLYHVDVDTTAKTCAIEAIADITTEAADYAANRYLRLRQGAIDTAIPGDRDGIFLDLYMGPSPQTYWQDITIKVWCTTTTPVTAV